MPKPLPWAVGGDQLLRRSGAQPRAGRSDATWPLATSDDEGFANEASDD